MGCSGVECVGCGVWVCVVWSVQCVVMCGVCGVEWYVEYVEGVLCDVCREREGGVTSTAVTTRKMEELIEMVQLVEEEENKEKKKEDNRGSFQWQDTLIRKVLCITDTLVFSLV